MAVKNDKNTKNVIRIIIYSFVALLVYFSLYPILLPLSERAGLGKIIYIIYEPYEFLKCRNEALWSYSEKIYDAYGGKEKPQDRYFFKTLRRCIEYYKDGKKEIDVYYRGGKRDGLFESYTSKGILLARCHYKDGLLDGLAETWYFDGNKRTIAYYKDDKIVGHDIQYYKNQNVRHNINYNQEGDRDGEALWYDKSGNLLAKGIYKDDNPWNGSFINYGIWIEYKNGVPVLAKRLKSNSVISFEEAAESIEKSMKKSKGSYFYLEEDSDI